MPYQSFELRSGQAQPLPYSDGNLPAVNDRVMVLDSELDCYQQAVQSKIRGREGIVKCFTYPTRNPT